MAPIRTRISPNEGSILLAVSAFQSGQFRSIGAAARAYNVALRTLLNRINRVTLREEYRLTNIRLSKHEEEALIKMILKLDS